MIQKLGGRVSIMDTQIAYLQQRVTAALAEASRQQRPYVRFVRALLIVVVYRILNNAHNFSTALNITRATKYSLETYYRAIHFPTTTIIQLQPMEKQERRPIEEQMRTRPFSRASRRGGRKRRTGLRGTYSACQRSWSGLLLLFKRVTIELAFSLIIRDDRKVSIPMTHRQAFPCLTATIPARRPAHQADHRCSSTSSRGSTAHDSCWNLAENVNRHGVDGLSGVGLLQFNYRSSTRVHVLNFHLLLFAGSSRFDYGNINFQRETHAFALWKDCAARSNWSRRWRWWCCWW